VADTRTVLIVDDDDGVRSLAAEVFDGLGHRVIQASNGKAALEALAAYPEISVLFTDVVMPGMSGQQLADEATRRRPDLLVVMTSGYVKGPPIVDTAFVQKPWRLGDLQRTVQELLGVRS